MTSVRNKWLISSRSTTLLLLIITIFVIMSAIKGSLFYSSKNLSSIFSNLSYDMLLACGMTFVLILGGIDLSVGSVLAFTGIVVTTLLRNGESIAFAIGLGLLVSMLIGTTNGLLVSVFNIAPFIATLAMMSVFRGMSYVMTSGYFVVGLPEVYSSIARGSLLGISNKNIISVGIMAILSFLSIKHVSIRRMFYVGNNYNAAFLSGISARKTTILGYMICSILAGIAGILITSSFDMGQASFGVGYEMRAISAAVIGGASMSGGEGDFIGTALGVILVALVNNVFIMFNGSPNWSTAISGIMLIVAVALDILRSKRRPQGI
mgnify:CR=1 FL=1